MEEPKVVILVFSSGKLVIVGAKKERQIREAAKKMREILMEKRAPLLGKMNLIFMWA